MREFPKTRKQTLVHDGGKLLYLPSIREISLPANFANFIREWFRKCNCKLIDKPKVLCFGTVASQLIVTLIKPFQSSTVLAETKTGSRSSKSRTIFYEGLSLRGPHILPKTNNQIIVREGEEDLHFKLQCLFSVYVTVQH